MEICAAFFVAERYSAKANNSIRLVILWRLLENALVGADVRRPSAALPSLLGLAALPLAGQEFLAFCIDQNQKSSRGGFDSTKRMSRACGAAQPLPSPSGLERVIR